MEAFVLRVYIPKHAVMLSRSLRVNYIGVATSIIVFTYGRIARGAGLRRHLPLISVGCEHPFITLPASFLTLNHVFIISKLDI